MSADRVAGLIGGISLLLFAVDSVATTRAADTRGLPYPSAERTAFVRDFRGVRSSAELWGVPLAFALSFAARARRTAVHS